MPRIKKGESKAWFNQRGCTVAKDGQSEPLDYTY